MRRLIYYEIQKILKKQTSVFLFILILVMSMLYTQSTYQNMYSFDGKLREGNGKEAVKIDKFIAQKYQGILTDKKVQEMLKDFRIENNMTGVNLAYIYQNSIQSAVYSRFADQNGAWNGKSVSDIYGTEDINVGYIEGWLRTSNNMRTIFLLFSFVIIVIVIPIFSGEYGKTDNIILVCKYGRGISGIAKIVASYIITFFSTLFFITINIIMALCLYGKEGLNCSILFSSIEFAEDYIPYNIDCIMLLWYQVILIFAGMISITGIALVVSSICNNQILALAETVTIYLLPILIPVSENNALYKIFILAPIYHFQFISIMSIEKMENGILYAIWAIPIAMGIGLCGSIIAYIIFKKHQVS